MALSITSHQFDEYILWEVKRAPHTQKNWQGIFAVIEDYFEDKEWSRSNVRSFCQSLIEGGKKYSTVNNYIKFLKHIDACQKTSEMAGFKRFSEDTPHKEYLTVEEAKKIIECQKLGLKGSTDLYQIQTVLFRFLLGTGCRIMEALSLTYNDVFTDHVVFRLTKTHTARHVYISPDIYKALLTIRRSGEYVFMWNGKRLIQQVCHRELRDRAKICGINKKIGCHTLRHTFVTLMGERDANVLKVGAMTGQTPNTIMKYYHSSLHHQKQVASLNPLESGQVTAQDVIDRLKSVVSDYAGSEVRIEVVDNQEGMTLRVSKTQAPTCP